MLRRFQLPQCIRLRLSMIIPRHTFVFTRPSFQRRQQNCLLETFQIHPRQQRRRDENQDDSTSDKQHAVGGPWIEHLLQDELHHEFLYPLQALGRRSCSIRRGRSSVSRAALLRVCKGIRWFFKHQEGEGKLRRFGEVAEKGWTWWGYLHRYVLHCWLQQPNGAI